MNLNRALWEKGDFTKIAALMRESGEALVKSLGVTPPLRVLDLGCGDGTTAVPLALLGAEVVGIDIAENLVAGSSFTMQQRCIEGDHAYILWAAETADNSYEFATDTFVVRSMPRAQAANSKNRVRDPAGGVVHK